MDLTWRSLSAQLAALGQIFDLCRSCAREKKLSIKIIATNFKSVHL